ncbi:MAG: hypothetical protein JNM30_02715 [Rhodospirillales bacterium]|nr:hypothetical protein [Rhodospirillales bacterium]
MIRYALATALLLGSFGAAVAAEPTPSTSQLALQIRACNQLDDQAQRESCKTNARAEAIYKVRTPYREPGRFERSYK